MVWCRRERLWITVVVAVAGPGRKHQSGRVCGPSRGLQHTRSCTPGRWQSRLISGPLTWDELGVIGDRGDRIIEVAEPFWKTRFFPDASLNVAENLLDSVSSSQPAVMSFARRPFVLQGGQRSRSSVVGGATPGRECVERE